MAGRCCGRRPAGTTNWVERPATSSSAAWTAAACGAGAASARDPPTRARRTRTVAGAASAASKAGPVPGDPVGQCRGQPVGGERRGKRPFLEPASRTPELILTRRRWRRWLRVVVDQRQLLEYADELEQTMRLRRQPRADLELAVVGGGLEGDQDRLKATRVDELDAGEIEYYLLARGELLLERALQLRRRHQVNLALDQNACPLPACGQHSDRKRRHFLRSVNHLSRD